MLCIPGFRLFLIALTLYVFPGAVAVDFFEYLGEVVGGFKAQGISHFIDLHVAGQKHLLGPVYLLGVNILRESGLSVLLKENRQIRRGEAEDLGYFIELELAPEVFVDILLDRTDELVFAGAAVAANDVAKEPYRL